MSTIIDGTPPLKGWEALELHVDLLTGAVAASLNHRILLSPPFFCGQGWCAFVSMYDQTYYSLTPVPLARCSEEDAARFRGKRPMPREGFPPTASALKLKPYVYQKHERLLLDLRERYAEVEVFLKMENFYTALHALDAADENGSS